MIRQPSHDLSKILPRVIDQVDEAVDCSEVLRYLGYPAGIVPDDRIQNILDEWVEEAGHLAVPRATYVVMPVVEKTRRLLRVESYVGVSEFRGAIGEFLGASCSVAAFIATAGPEIENLASTLLRKGDALGAMIVNAVGAERAETAEAAVVKRLREEARPTGLAPTLPYSPGYCGMALTEQTKLFALFGTQNVGVTLTPECLMQPIKSVSGLIGLGLAEEVETYGTPCDRCELRDCNMRR